MKFEVNPAFRGRKPGFCIKHLQVLYSKFEANPAFRGRKLEQERKVEKETVESLKLTPLSRDGNGVPSSQSSPVSKFKVNTVFK